MIMDLLTRRATTTAETITVSSVFDPATGRNTNTEIITSIGNCIFYEGGSAKGFITSAMRERVSAVALFKPSVTVSGQRLRIDGEKNYTIIGQEDVANQGKVKVIYLSEIA